MELLSFISSVQLGREAAAVGKDGGGSASNDGMVSEQRKPASEAGDLPPYTHPVDIAKWQELGHRVVDFVAEYHRQLQAGAYPVQPQVRPGWLAELLPESGPQHPEELEAILEDFEHILIPGITHWQSPSFFGYFPCNSSFPAILADILSSGIGSVGFTWAASPAYEELGRIVVNWLAKLIGLPPCFQASNPLAGGCIQGSGSEAVLVALLAAKARALHGRPPQDAIKLVAYGTEHTHSCVQKACMIAGIIHYRALPTRREDAYSMQPESLVRAIEEDLARGLLPCYVCGTIGTTSSCAVDPIAEIGTIAQKYNIWLHVDAAWAGAFSILPEMHEAGYFKGLEQADSYSFNPHKGLLANFGCACLWVQDTRWVKAAMEVSPEYLRPESRSLFRVTTKKLVESGWVEDKDWEIPLGHRFRALKLWFVLRMYGGEGLRAIMRHRLAMQDLAERLLQEDGRFELMAPPRFGLLCFRLKGASDALNAKLLERLNATGKLLMVHSKLSGQYVLRMAIGTTGTQGEHIAAAWRLISQEASAVLEEQNWANRDRRH